MRFLARIIIICSLEPKILEMIESRSYIQLGETQIILDTNMICQKGKKYK